MSEVQTKSYSGVGRVWVRPYGTTTARRHVGNVRVLDLEHDINIERQPDYQRPGGGTAIRKERINQINANMEWLHFEPANWQLAMAGSLTEVATGPVTDEVVTLHKGSVCELAHLPSAITTVISTAATPVTLAAGTDYEMSAAGLYIPTTSAAIDASEYEVTYTRATQSVLQGATGTATVLDMLFEGLNDSDANKPVVLNLWRLSMPPANVVRLINLELGVMEFAAELLSDPTKGAGQSAYYRARMVS